MSEAISESAHVIPGGVLAGLIDRSDGFDQRGVPPARHLGLPSPYMTLIVMLDEPMQVTRRMDSMLPPTSFRTLVGGLHAQPVEISHDGVQSGIQLSIDPLASRSLFGVPAGELAELDLPGDDVLGRGGSELFDRVGAAVGWSERFGEIEALLSRRVLTAGPIRASPGGLPTPVRAAWALLRACGGAMPVAELAREVGWSERQLEKAFLREIGMSPKRAARVIRFDRARRMVQLQARDAGRSLNFARIAADCAFHDQPHLIREFRSFSGMAPTRWLAQEFGNVQVTAPLAT